MVGVTAIPAPEADPNCRACAAVRIEMSKLRTDLDVSKNKVESMTARMTELERDIVACREATLVGREIETIKRLQRSDLTQRRDLDSCYEEISRQRQEIERLLKLCQANKISTVKPGVPDPSPSRAVPGWGALTGGVGAQ